MALCKLSAFNEEVINTLPSRAREYVREKALLCQPDTIYICDGSEQESQGLIDLLEKQGKQSICSIFMLSLLGFACMEQMKPNCTVQYLTVDWQLRSTSY
ncbi:unnamed protein product [Protopolystoma xenopodis]|uniref:Phosphoenolpyruvate carboxykinase GTP-utilising N-terminal domain-containing protein n=1 Tax=Protopolystoma xenopodis TaxID=117903 RepID=A0A448WJ87_9PLAT|nr:unnamed protein product [Protopolystoma xenopodis]